MDDNNKKTPSSQNAAGAGPETYSQAPPQSVGYPQFPMGYQPQFMYYPMPPYMQGYPQSSMGSPPQETGPHQTPGLPHFGGGYPSFYPGPVPSTPQTGQTGEHVPPSQSAGQPTSSDGRTQVQESGPNQTIGPPYFSGYPSFYTGPVPSMPQAASKFPSQIAGGPKPSKGHPQQPQMMQVPPQMNPWFGYQQYCQPFQPPAGTREYSQPLQSQPPLIRQRWESTPNLHQGVTEMQSGLGRQGRQQSLNSLLEEDEFAGGNSGHFRRSNSTCSELGVDTRLSLDRIAVNHDTFPPTSPFSPTTADPLTATEGPPRTVKVGVGRDIQPKLVYEYYFQNAAIGGGQVEQVEIHTEERLVFVTFARAEDAARVSGRSHSIGQESVTVSLHVAPAQRPTYANKLLFHNLPDKLSSHHFRTLLKLVTGCAPVDILYGDEEGALVTFNERQDLERVQKMCQENDLDGRLLSVSRVPVSSAILVGNLNPFTAVETVRFFFHNHNRSGGGPVQNVDMIADECKCIVHFEDHKVIESVLGKEKLTLDDSILTITTYFECLGTSGGSEDPDNFPVPKSFSLKDVARAKLLFFQKCPAFWEELHQLLSELHAVPKCVDDKVVVDCTLTPEVPKARHLARTWKAEAQDAVMKCLVEVIVHEILVPQETWPVVETKLDGVVYGLAIAATKPDDRSLIVVGKEPSLTQLSEDIRATLKKEEAEIERKKLEVEETVTLEPHQIRLLEAIPFQPSQSDILVKTDSQKFVIVFQGNKFSVKDARLQMYELLQSVKAEQWSNISNAKQTLLQNKQGESFIMEKLKGKGVVAVWEIAADQEHITFYAFSVNNVKKAVSIADASLVEDVILCRESADLLQGPEWNDFVKELTDRHAGVLIISTNPKDQKISITCTDDILQSAQKEIHDFRERNTILKEVVCFSKNRQNFVVSFWSLKLQKIIKKLAEEKVQITSHKTNFTVKGTRHGLEEVRKKLQILGQQIFVHKETYTTLAMVKYFRHPECQQGLDLIGSSNKCVIALEFEPDSPLQVKVEDEKKVKFPDGVKVGDIADTKGHGFGGKALYHSTLPHWSSANSKENLREVVTMYLTKASSQRSISMNLSFLDTGQLSYPRDETARIMLDTVDTFQRASPSTSLRDVRIVVKHKDTQALQEFRHVLDGRPTVPGEKTITFRIHE
ncbi:hypothetical protein V1264_014185 [Littorina saxatilis]|uniref:RRM domain-containing protein n=1 Tax=Littorina saxatilis TaxID=31220 RepID=A0AAN9BQK4_9CAEN